MSWSSSLVNTKRETWVLPERQSIEQRIRAALDATPHRIPVLVGGCGTGRSTLLQRTHVNLGQNVCQYINAESVALTPEGLLNAVTDGSNSSFQGSEPYPSNSRHSPRSSVNVLLNFFKHEHLISGLPPTFLIDEVLDIRTLESFPGLRGVMREVFEALAESPNRFVLSSRFVNRTIRNLKDLSDRFEVIQIPPLSATEATATLELHGVGRNPDERNDIGRMTHALTDGRAAYVEILASSLAATNGASGGDPVSALTGQMVTGTNLWWRCRFSYELRLHRARGYGSLKGILAILAHEEPQTLTQISKKLGRTPGSTKDYLSWLEEVDLVQARQKRYSYTDPILRLWVRLHAQATPPTETDLAREVQEYAVQRLPFLEESNATVDLARPAPSEPEFVQSTAREVLDLIEYD